MSNPGPAAPAPLTRNAIDAFFGRINDRIKNFKISKRLGEHIDPLALQNILQHILNEQSVNTELQKEGTLHGFAGHGVARSFDILPNDEGELMLIVRLKSKKAHANAKPWKMRIITAHKIIKPAWRVDITPDEPWVDQTSIITQKTWVALQREENISKEISHLCPSAALLFTRNYMAELYQKPHHRPRVSVYARRQQGNLDDLIQGKLGPLSLENKDIIAYELTYGLHILHRNGIAHQDLRAHNILVYPLDNIWHIQLTDFEFSVSVNKPDRKAQASTFHESPQILFAYQRMDPHPVLHKAYFEVDNNSYGYFQFAKKSDGLLESERAQCAKPNIKNDIWALGILLFYLEYNFLPEADHEDRIQKTPLLKHCLDPKEHSRFTAEQLLDLFPEAAVKFSIMHSTPERMLAKLKI
jgi:serine/threonine protein kinase